MMRQYELVERVQRYKPDVNEALLNKAYVYAMQKHGHQKRASGDPYFSHPLEVAAILGRFIAFEGPGDLGVDRRGGPRPYIAWARYGDWARAAS